MLLFKNTVILLRHDQNLLKVTKTYSKWMLQPFVVLSLGTYNGSKRNSVETMLMQIFEGQTKGSMVFFILANSRIPDF